MISLIQQHLFASLEIPRLKVAAKNGGLSFT